ncbi:DUF6894 family protein [Phyllobacterium sp. 22552]|uniref:DUF6894 family protein n=1 Tax=Phyllobacterium sp. 22552 TaxID=3453941 RepID=UPI003F836316
MKYRYEFQEDFEQGTVSDIELESDIAALREGYQTAVEMVQEGIFAGLNQENWTVKIFDENNRSVGRIRFSDVLRPNGLHGNFDWEGSLP